MTLDEFRESLTATEPPAGLTHALVGLWWDAKGDWTRCASGKTNGTGAPDPSLQRPFVMRSKNLAASTAVSC